MRMEKINDGQIRCVLTESDLASRKLNIKELKYGSAQTNALFKELIDEAVKSYRFNEENYPVMVEAIPMGQGSLMFILSAVDDIEEIDPHFAHFAQSEPLSDGHIGVPFTESPEAYPEECVFLLNSIEDLFPLAKHFGKSFPGETLLYNGPRPHTYYLLIMTLGKMDGSDFLRFINAMEEFVPSCFEEPLLAAHLTEHETPVMVSPLRSVPV